APCRKPARRRPSNGSPPFALRWIPWSLIHRIKNKEIRMSWLDKLIPPRIKRNDHNSRRVPEGVWTKCPSCEAVLYRDDLQRNMSVCPKCDHHLRIGARERINLLLDAEGRYEVGQEVLPVDSLKFRDSKRYPDRLSAATTQTGETDALVVMGGTIMSVPAVVACFEFDFMGGSMGS